MTIFLPIKVQATGGTSTFAKKFQAGMRKLGHEVIFKPQAEYDVLLASPTAPWRYLFDARRRHKPIVHRLDGVYYPTTTAGWWYPLYNVRLRLLRNYLADAIIYQSKYSQKTCRIFLGTPNSPLLTSNSPIIYNGVDLAHFSPHGEQVSLRDTPDQHIFITASRFRRPDQIIPLLQSFQRYCDQYYANSKLVVIGNFSLSSDKEPREVLAKWGQKTLPQNVEFKGVVPNEQLPTYLRAADVFVFTHTNPPCPNNVLEALASGLPICGIADGAMPELVESGREGELVPATGEAFYQPRPVSALSFAAAMNRCHVNRQQYSAAARQRAEQDFDLQQMIRNYAHLLAKLA